MKLCFQVLECCLLLAGGGSPLRHEPLILVARVMSILLVLTFLVGSLGVLLFFIFQSIKTGQIKNYLAIVLSKHQ